MITLESFRGSSCSVGDPVDEKDTTSGLVEPESVVFFFCYCEAFSLFAVSRGVLFFLRCMDF